MAQDFLVNSTGAGDSTLVASPGPRQFIRVLSYHLTVSATQTATWKSASTTKNIDYLTIGNAVNANGGQTGVFDCAPGEALVLTVSGGNVGGCGKYTIMGGM